MCSSTIYDRGIYDHFNPTAEWSDGVTTEGVQSCVPDTESGPCTSSRTVTWQRVIENELAFDEWPVVLTVADDDTAQVKFFREKADVLVNKDDDNMNGLEDLLDSGFEEENDLKSFSIQEMLGTDIDPAEGEIKLFVNGGAVRI